MKPSIVFRVDSGSVIGAGHLVRCLALADRFLVIGYSIHFICCPYEGYLAHLIHEKQYQLHLLDVKTAPVIGNVRSWVKDEKEDALTVKHILTQIGNVEWLVVDHYALTAEWHFTFDKLVVISDEIKPSKIKNNSSVHIIVCQNPLATINDNNDSGANKLLTGKLSTSKLLIGNQYYLLQDKFINQHIHTKSLLLSKKIKVLIAMGATDPVNATDVLLNILDHDSYEIHLALSSAAPALSLLREKYHKFGVVFHIDENILELYNDIDIVIGTPSVSAIERVSMGIFSILVSTGSDHTYIADYLNSHGGALFLGQLENVNKNLINDAIARVKNAKKTVNLYDALGSFRVAEEMVGRHFTLRKAKEIDVDILFHLQTQTGTRQYFLNESVPSYSEHVAWFSSILNNKCVDLFIAEWFGYPCAMGRLDYDNKSSAEISIIIDQYFRGNGLSVTLIEALVEKSRCAYIHARVMKENKASINAFYSSGFKDNNNPFSYKRLTVLNGD